MSASKSDDLDPLADEDLAASVKKKKLSGKMLVIIGAVVVLLLGGGGAAWFFMHGKSDKKEEAGAEHGESGKHGEHGEAGPIQTTFFDLPDILVNLDSAGRKNAYLKLKVSLEIDRPTAVPELEKLMPRIVDNFQVYLRELRVEDLDGSAGMFRLKEELLTRVNAAVTPVVVKDVLFKEMLVQ